MKKITDLISVCVLLSASATAQVAARAMAQVTPQELFRQAHTRLVNVTPPLNKGYALGQLLQKAWGMPIEELAQWSEEAFDVSQQMPLGSRRVFVQEMAISVMARRDPDRALAMLTRMDAIAPDSLNSFNIGHGLAVANVFSSMLAKHGPSIEPSLMDNVNAIAAKGLYPYLALTVFTSAGDDERARLFHAGVTAYTRSKPSVTNEFEFVNFLKRVGPRVPAATASTAAMAIAARMQQFATSGATCNSTLRLYTDKGMIVLDCGERVIYEALPTLDKMNGDVAAKLRAAPKFQQLQGAKVRSFMPMANPRTPSEKATESQAEFDVGMMVHDLAKEDPERAARLASGMTDEIRRLNMNIQIAGEMAPKEPAKAQAILYQALNDVAKVDDLSWKLTLTSNIATTATKLGNTTLAVDAIKTVFALAHDFAKFAHEQKPEQRSLYASNGYRAWVATRLGASIAPQLTLGLIPTIGDDECEAYLLIAFADAIAHPMPLR